MAIIKKYVPDTMPDGHEINFLAQVMSLIQLGYPVELNANEVTTTIGGKQRHTSCEIVVGKANALDLIVLKATLRDDGKLELHAFRRFWAEGKVIEGVIRNFFNGTWYTAKLVLDGYAAAITDPVCLASVVNESAMRADNIRFDADKFDTKFTIVAYTI